MLIYIYSNLFELINIDCFVVHCTSQESKKKKNTSVDPSEILDESCFQLNTARTFKDKILVE